MADLDKFSDAAGEKSIKTDREIIRELLCLENEFPRSLLRTQLNGITVEFFIRKAFWKQVYGKYVIDRLTYRSEPGIFFSFQKILMLPVNKLIERKTVFASETEEACLIFILGQR